MSDIPAPPAVYADSSFLVAAIAPDDPHHRSATEWMAASARHLVTSVVAEVELGRVLSRRAAGTNVQQAARELLEGCDRVEFTGVVRVTAVEVKPSSFRSLDAIHVATALAAGVLEFATFDVRQRVAAEEMGLRAIVL